MSIITAVCTIVSDDSLCYAILCHGFCCKVAEATNLHASIRGERGHPRRGGPAACAQEPAGSVVLVQVTQLVFHVRTPCIHMHITHNMLGCTGHVEHGCYIFIIIEDNGAWVYAHTLGLHVPRALHG